MSEPAPSTRGGELDRTRELTPGELEEPTPVARLPETLPPGTMAGQYVLKRLIGAGGGGMVYAAEHKMLKRTAAVKVLRRDKAALPSMVARFVREARAVNMIGHPNIVDIFEFGELTDGRPFYVMELLDGVNLRKLLHLHGRFSPSEVLDVFEPVCAALEAAHKAGVVHRDLKASNISVLDDGNRRVVKLLDFGIAKLLHPEPGGAGLTEAGSMLGTSHYMAPEQIRGESIDARADVYALGVLLYQLLTAQYPFHSEQPEEIAWMHLATPAPRPSQVAPVPAALDLVVRKAMEKQRDDRFASAADFLEALREASGVRGAPGEQSQEVPAYGIYVEVRPQDESAESEMDDEMLEDMAIALDFAEERLTETGFLLPLRTANALLGVRGVAGGVDPAEEPVEVALAREILEELSVRLGADPRLHVNVAVRRDTAVFVEKNGAPSEVASGPLLSIENWVSQANVEGVEITTSGERDTVDVVLPKLTD